MTPLVPIMLFGWVPFTIFLFFALKPHRAVLVSVIGGWLLLPTFGYNVEGIPAYDKGTAIALGLILGGWLSGQRQKANFEWKIYDLPMVMWCLSAIPTSLTNQLGLYDGLSVAFTNTMIWGIPYLAGRIYFKDSEALRDLCLGIVIGGLLYVPLCLYEIRMSPRLNINLYGFFPHDWIQHKRYGGWRPIVFMQHGLMVALWLAISTTVAFWLWRSRSIEHIKGIPMAFIVAALAATTLLSKSANGWFALVLGCSLYFVYRQTKTNLPLVVLLLSIPLYLTLRITNILSVDDITMVVAHLFDADRIDSLNIRLQQEELFISHTLNSPLFGWGGFSRNWPVDPDTGRKLISMVDPLWLINFSRNGFFGITTFIMAMLIGPWMILRSTRMVAKDQNNSQLFPIILSIVVIFFMIDSIFNGMINPVYVVSTGTLISWKIAIDKTSINQRSVKPKHSKYINT